MKAAKANSIPVFVSPHYYFPHDNGWKFEGALEKLMHTIGMFDRKDPLDLEGFEGIYINLRQHLPFCPGQVVPIHTHAAIA